ncbi:MAG: hypothetical protein K0V04_12225 [Deltaproteobacteria bacterium]|nr:hypothetical protein [Deltaproteobacteria bacterium]
MTFYLRNPQIDALETDVVDRFDDDMVAMVYREFPVDAQLLGTAGLRPVIAHARRRARHHRLHTRGAVAGYLCLMMVLGGHFDTDPQLPWAAAALTLPRAGSSTTTIQRLLSRAVDHLALTCGPRGLEYIRVLRRVAATSWSDIVEQDPAPWLRALYPSKANAIGPHGVAKLQCAGAAVAERHQLTPAIGGMICAGAMLVLGAGCHHDPLHPWLAAALVRADEPTPIAHTQRLWAALRLAAERGLEARIRVLRED